MRNRELHDALRAFALEAAALLRDDQAAGAEIEFDLAEDGRRGGPALYHYRPLTTRFVAERWRRLHALPAFGPAAEALGAGAAAYLRANGLRGAEAEPALRAMLERLYEDATDLAFPDERFERVYADVERTLYEHRQPATVLAAVHGLELAADRVELAPDLALVRGGLADAPDAALWSGSPGASGPFDDGARREPNALVALTRELGPGDDAPVSEARERFHGLLTGLRLWKAGGVALAATGWRRTGAGAWQPFELDQTGVPRGEPWTLEADEGEDLRAFLAALARGRASGPVAWALSRFEMGCGRGETEALSDYLLALRALLDRGEGGSGADLALRVAVLCAADGERRRVQRRVELAQSLERLLMGDAPGEDYVDAVGPDSARALVDEVERHLRALLRDVICGHLDGDLHAVADELLLASEERRPTPIEPGPAPAVERQIEALEAAGEEIGVTAVEHDAPLWDDDPAGYSAPV